VVANLEELEKETDVVIGNVVLLNALELRATDIAGVILLPPTVSNILGYLPNEVTLSTVTYHFLLVAFLTSREHEVWKAKGHDALMDFFSTHNKDLIAFGNNALGTEFRNSGDTILN
jgi:hypothetical protein